MMETESSVIAKEDATTVTTTTEGGQALSFTTSSNNNNHHHHHEQEQDASSASSSSSFAAATDTVATGTADLSVVATASGVSGADRAPQLDSSISTQRTSSSRTALARTVSPTANLPTTPVASVSSNTVQATASSSPSSTAARTTTTTTPSNNSNSETTADTVTDDVAVMMNRGGDSSTTTTMTNNVAPSSTTTMTTTPSALLPTSLGNNHSWIDNNSSSSSHPTSPHHGEEEEEEVVVSSSLPLIHQQQSSRVVNNSEERTTTTSSSNDTSASTTTPVIANNTPNSSLSLPNSMMNQQGTTISSSTTTSSASNTTLEPSSLLLLRHSPSESSVDTTAAVRGGSPVMSERRRQREQQQQLHSQQPQQQQQQRPRRRVTIRINNNNSNSNNNTTTVTPLQNHPHRHVLRIPRGSAGGAGTTTITLQHHQPLPQRIQQQPPPLDPRYLIPVSNLQPQVLPEEQQILRTSSNSSSIDRSSSSSAATKSDVAENKNANDDENGTVETVLGENNEASNNNDAADINHHDDTIATANNLLERFKCTICCDFLDQPSGCGRCVGRFCATCLQQYLQHQQQRQQQQANTNTTTATPPAEGAAAAKCPTCRNPFTAVVPDTEMAAQMATHSLPCRYAECSSSTSHGAIPLSEYKSHEENCPAVRVFCRYSLYGCCWTGKRSDVPAHEASDCALARIPGFLEQHRAVQVNHRRQVDEFEHRIAHLVGAIHGMNHQVRQAVQGRNQQQLYHRSNPLHLVAFATTAVVTTPRLISNKLLWENMIQTEDARASVSNALAMFPTLLLILRIVLEGVHYHSRAWTREKIKLALTSVESVAASTSAKDIEAANSMLDHLVIVCLFGLLGILIILCCFADDQSPRAWTSTSISAWFRRRAVRNDDRHKYKIFEFFALVAIFLVYFYLVDFYDNNLIPNLLWGSIAVASFFLPSVLSAISFLAASHDADTSRFTISDLLGRIGDAYRAYSPLREGMGYGLIVALSGPSSTLDGVMLYLALVPRLQSRWKELGTIMGYWNKISQITSRDLRWYLGWRLAYSAVHGRETTFYDACKRAFVALCRLVAVNIFFNLLIMAGIACGLRIFRQSYRQTTSIASASDTTGLGIVVFAVWVVFLLLIVTT